ncbi:hypothetical protein V8C37DRAFT_388942 [Trichoderma ceciliae]
MEMILVLEKTRWTLVVMLAVLKSGASFALMETSHPLRRRQTICDVVSPPVLLASQ